jgi:hypothetical protein
MNKVIRKNKGALQDLIKKLKSLSSSEVAVGFPAHKGLDTPYYKTGASVIQVAVWNNYGTRKIPARPFFDFASVKIQRRFKSRVQADVKLCLAGKLPLKKMLHTWGVEAKGMIQEEIGVTGPPNKWSTIMRKMGTKAYHKVLKTPGETFEGKVSPLIDTGHMRQSVTYVVRKRSE